MKSGLHLLTFFLFAIAFQVQADDQITIGVSSSLTGVASTYGQDIKNVVLFANDKIGGGRFKIVIEDDKCNGKDAVTAAKKLVNIDKVQGVIGYGCSGALLAASPIFNRAKVPVIGTETSAAKISEAGDHIFRTQPSDRAGVQILYSYLQKNHKVFGALNAQTEFCQGIINDLKNLASGGSLKIESEDFLSTDADYRTTLLKLMARNIDGLLVNAQDEAGTYQLIKQAKELGFNGPFYTFYNGTSDSFFEIAGKDAEGVITVDGPSFDDIANSEGKALFNEFISRYGPMKAWNYGFATTFEAFRALTEALTKSSDPQKYLLETKFQGIFGPYSFDTNGDIVGLSLALKRNQNGKAKRIN